MSEHTFKVGDKVKIPKTKTWRGRHGGISGFNGEIFDYKLDYLIIAEFMKNDHNEVGLKRDDDNHLMANGFNISDLESYEEATPIYEIY